MNRRLGSWLALVALLSVAGGTLAARVSDIRGTKHNLSSSGTGTVKATSETQVCVFCHTPHGATPGLTPLWNRAKSDATYTVYTSSSLDANSVQGSLDQPGGSSKLCLSCHDGTLAIGNVNVLNGAGSATTQGTQSIPMSGTGTGGVMPSGSGDTTGFTRKLGTDLTNDHPISVTYDSTLAARDGELRNVDASQKWPADGSVVGVRSSGYKPKAPLEPTGAAGAGQIQCATCHDPHIRETDSTKGNQKFLRLNRFQEATPTNNHDASNDIVCLSCHDKNQGTGAWAYSVHANPLVATPTYTATAATQREFPASLPVWKAACLNCHDTHTVQGARRLLREGTDSVASPKAAGSPALEETCYQCHTTSASAAITPTTTVPNIKGDFALTRHMPIASTDQAAGSEVHDIGGNFSDGFNDCSTTTNKCGKDFIEQRSKLGVSNLNNRHAECTDCHNPHRVVKFNSFLGNPAGTISGTPDGSATHPHTTGTSHTNIASGVLRGAWGVEPVYTASATFANKPSSYIVKRGDPGSSGDSTVGAAYVTREYQVCLKCHSDYAYSDDNVYPSSTSRPQLGGTGLTPSPRTNFTSYTNQAKEFQAPAGHKAEVTTTDSGASAGFSTNNHRSWHPVMDNTGRTTAIRGSISSSNWLQPFNNDVGNQTMYCSDCHGTATANGTSAPTSPNPWGPHGSTNDFLLKGTWNTSSGVGQQGAICFKCHNYNVYTGNGTKTGFYISSGRASGNDGHKIHNSTGGTSGKIRCNWCHVAVPHGWKNKALLVNLTDVGPEAGQAAGTVIADATIKAGGYTNGPYYRNAMLKVRSFAPSGQWSLSNCGVGTTEDQSRAWMKDNVCNTPP